ncbi:hypothetical protein Tcan_07551 [Toxocara canis]|uniref:ShKT domain-containing protein n=1 Tax=Toxocara canis TaxID=6265 RepID=A0A0B2VKL2_TOXCA|nr:hypothetical protein Tcan_07551 [Toxocara canis]
MFGNVALFLLLSITISYAQDCADDVDFCHSIVDNKQCSLGAAKRHCRKSCGHCSEPKPPQPTPSPDCKDDRDDCENAFYICGEYPQFAAQCKQTCEICGQPERPPPTPGSGCEDEVRFCHSVVDHGICGLNAAKRLCRKSCGHCEAPVPALPTPTDGCKDDRDDCEGAFYVCGEYPESAAMCKMTCQLCGEVTALTNKPLEKTTMMPGEISTTRAQEIRTTEGRQSTTMKIEQTTTMKIKEPTTPTTVTHGTCVSMFIAADQTTIPLRFDQCSDGFRNACLFQRLDYNISGSW